MSSMFKKILFAGTAAAALLAGVASAQAGGFALREQSASGLGLGFAGVAAGTGGLSSMFWNPATMTNLAGWQTSMVASGIIPYSKITPQAGTAAGLLGLGGTGDMAKDAFLPASYSSYQFNDKLWFGLSVNTPFGLATKNPNTWAGQLYGRTSKVISTDISPSIAYKVTDWLSLAGGLQVEYFKTRLTALYPLAPVTSDLTGKSWGIGYTLGATIKPLAGTEIGIGFRSEVREALKGTLAVGAGTPTNIKSNLSLPAELTLGVRQKVTEALTLAAGFEWTNWKRFGSFPVTSAATGATVTNLAFKYRDGWYASVGGEYKVTDAWTARIGLGYERSPISDTVRSVRLPDNDRIWTTIGAGYKFNEKLSFDVAYAHIFPKSTSINITSAANPTFIAPTLPFVATVSSHVDIISVGLNYRWDDPKVAEPIKPIVRKY